MRTLKGLLPLHKKATSILQTYFGFNTFRPGQSETIAQMRELTNQTVENYLFQSYKKSYPIAWGIFFNEEEEAEILKAVKSIKEIKLKKIKEKLPEHYTYTKIKSVLIKNGKL